MEVAGFVTGALCVWLATRQHVANFPVGIANNVVFAVLFWQSGIPANAALQVVYLALAALGWWWWVRGGPDSGRMPVAATPRLVWPVAVVVTVAATVAIAALLTHADESVRPSWDAGTTALSLVAQVMMGRKWLGSWAVWIVTDVLLVGLYASLGLYLTAALYVLFIALCVSGWRAWRADLQTAAPAPSPSPTPSEAVVPR